MLVESRKYKDTVFRMLYNNKQALLELYNALNNTDCSNPDNLTITTLEGNTYLNMKNDVSFILNFELNLFEHQSTPCPNIPLRNLYYIAASYMNIIPITKTYRDSIIKIPTPRFFVFYNGTHPMKDITEYKLSDLFSNPLQKTALELTTTVYNVNEGHNAELMKASKTLKGYSIFVAKVRKYKEIVEEKYNSSHKTSLNLLVDKEDVLKELISEAVAKAIDECIDENILKDFFITYRQEVIRMSILEYTAEGHIKELQDESYENGVNSGIKNTTDLFSWLITNNRMSDIEKAVNDSSYLNQLFEEFNNQK